MWTREDKFHISKRPCIILFIFIFFIFFLSSYRTLFCRKNVEYLQKYFVAARPLRRTPRKNKYGVRMRQKNWRTKSSESIFLLFMSWMIFPRPGGYLLWWENWRRTVVYLLLSLSRDAPGFLEDQGLLRFIFDKCVRAKIIISIPDDKKTVTETVSVKGP